MLQYLMNYLHFQEMIFQLFRVYHGNVYFRFIFHFLEFSSNLNLFFQCLCIFFLEFCCLFWLYLWSLNQFAFTTRFFLLSTPELRKLFRLYEQLRASIQYVHLCARNIFHQFSIWMMQIRGNLHSWKWMYNSLHQTSHILSRCWSFSHPFTVQSIACANVFIVSPCLLIFVIENNEYCSFQRQFCSCKFNICECKMQFSIGLFVVYLCVVKIYWNALGFFEIDKAPQFSIKMATTTAPLSRAAAHNFHSM